MRSKINSTLYLLAAYLLGGTLLFYASSTLAKDLGTNGSVYPIAETDFIVMAQKKVQEALGSNGGLKGWQAQQQRSLEVTADRPTAVPGLRPTIQMKRWVYDPSFVMPRDVRAANGVILLKAGSRFNPLEKTQLKNTLIFFDGDDLKQVTFAQKQNQDLKGQVLLILVNGSLKDASSHFPQQHLYFDQGGRLTQKLQITQIPAIVSQVGNQLEISEVVP